MFALVWSIGASVDENGRALFNNHVREICSDPANSKSQVGFVDRVATFRT